MDLFCKLFVIKALDECDSGITQLQTAQLIVNDRAVLEAVNAYQHTTIKGVVASLNSQYETLKKDIQALLKAPQVFGTFCRLDIQQLVVLTILSK